MITGREGTAPGTGNLNRQEMQPSGKGDDIGTLEPEPGGGAIGPKILFLSNMAS